LYQKIAGIYSKVTEMEKARYELFFSFQNLFAVFRMKKDENKLDQSQEGEIVFSERISSSDPEGVLKDILFLARLERIDLRINDVVVLRYNGQVKSYRFRGISGKNTTVKESFVLICDFIREEKQEFLTNIHGENRVLSVLDGRILHLSNINLDKTIPCAIDGKTFESSGETIMSDYSLYVYDNNIVHIIDPEQRPFMQINVALLFFNQMKYKKQPLLLLNRKELEMIRDFYQLRKLAFV